MSKKHPPGITYNPSKDNYNYLVDLQADYRKDGKTRGFDKIIDLIITERRLG